MSNLMDDPLTPDWFETPLGRYLVAAEQTYFDAEVADVFGFNAFQLGFTRYNIKCGSGVKAADGYYRRVHRVHMATDDTLQGIDDLGSHFQSVHAQMRHGAVRALAKGYLRRQRAVEVFFDHRVEAVGDIGLQRFTGVDLVSTK